MQSITKTIDAFIHVIKWIAMVIIVLMMLAIAVGVVFRLFNAPLVGNVEIVEIFQIVLIMVTLAYAESLDRHIKIGIIVDRLPRRVQTAIDVFGYVTIAALCFIIAKIFWDAALEDLYVLKETTLLLEFPHYILKFVASIGFLLWGLAAVNGLLKMRIGKVNINEPAG